MYKAIGHINKLLAKEIMIEVNITPIKLKCHGILLITLINTIQVNVMAIVCNAGYELKNNDL